MLDLFHTVLQALGFIGAIAVLITIVTVISNLTSGRLYDLKQKPNLRDIRNKKFKTKPRNNPIT